jgi:hypothetical protein
LLRIAIHGAWSVSVPANIASLAAEYVSQRPRDSRSIGDSFQRRTGSIWRIANRVRCSRRVTENQSLVRCVPASTTSFSKSGV